MDVVEEIIPSTLPRGVDPLDFSFKCLCSLNDLIDEIPRPREGKKLKFKMITETVAKNQVNNFLEMEQENIVEECVIENSDSDTDSDDSEFTSKQKITSPDDDEDCEKIDRNVYIATSIRLNNNTISDLANLQMIMSKILVNWHWLAWIDLSFNDISVLDVSFSDFPELRLIYLHGNAIEHMKEVDKLKSVRNLHTLTLHGNPLEMTENYRYHVLTKLPYLKSLDFSAVTKQEKNLSTRRKFSNKKL